MCTQPANGDAQARVRSSRLRSTWQQVAAPGDFVADLPPSGQVRIGSGVQAAETSLLSSKAGLVRCTRAGKLWIDARQKRCCFSNAHAIFEALDVQVITAEVTLNHRYIPAVDESVIAIITERYGDSWNTDINGTYGATLPALAFEGAVKHRAYKM